MSQRLTVAAAVATIAASLSLYPLVSGWLWFWEGAGVVTVVALAGGLTRLRALPVPVCALAGLVGVLLYLNCGNWPPRAWRKPTGSRRPRPPGTRS